MTNQVRILPRCVAQIIRWKGNRDIKLSDTKKHSDQLKLCAYNMKAILQRLMVNWRGLQGKNHYSLSIEQDEGGVPLCPFEHTNKKQNKFVDLGRYLSSVAVQCHQCQQGPTISTKSDILATIQNHSRTPKTCFTVGLEFLDKKWVADYVSFAPTSNTHHSSPISSSNTMKWHCTEHYCIW